MSTRLQRNIIKNFILANPNTELPNELLTYNEYKITKVSEALYQRLLKQSNDLESLEIWILVNQDNIINTKIKLFTKEECKRKTYFFLGALDFYQVNDSNEYYYSKKDGFSLDQLIAYTRIFRGNIKVIFNDARVEIDKVEAFLDNPRPINLFNCVLSESVDFVKQYLEKKYNWSSFYNNWFRNDGRYEITSFKDGRHYGIDLVLKTSGRNILLHWVGNEPLNLKQLSKAKIKADHSFEQIALGLVTTGKLIYSDLDYKGKPQ